MEKIVNSVNKLLPLGKKAKKYLPFFIGFKLLTFTGFLTYIMNSVLLPHKLRLLYYLLVLVY